MRDLLMLGLFTALIYKTLKDPLWGVLGWVWMGVMNPHRLAYGFAHDAPWSMLIALTLFLSLLIHRDKLVKFPVNAVTILLGIWIVWIGVSPLLFSFYPDKEMHFWSRAFKVLLMVLVSLLVVQRRRDLDWLVLVLVVSIGYYGIKGGVFTVLSGGSARVWGPEGSFIEDNNSLALATIMTVPLIRYLQLQSTQRWQRHLATVAMLLCMASAVGSQSRGAFLAIVMMSFFMWLKSRNKLPLALVVLVALPLIFVFMPDSWTDRMETIRTYDQDASAMGRINAWQMAWRLATDLFPFGGGFTVAGAAVFAKYAPDPSIPLTAHSIYFQAMGEHGFMGLALFVGIFAMTWRLAGATIRASKAEPDLQWARDLAAMCQVGLIGYATGGAFLSLVYFDLPYYLVLIVVVVNRIVAAEMAQRKQAAIAAGQLPRDVHSPYWGSV
ncbi:MULTISPECIES: putative O-glycosylation ligase, exosortase A system-associated [unclassified Roseateles]|jgi:putative inorganic carbon (hco3(-)) transporter|nr:MULTISPECIES: putative O-glycosylation ligase, exosortase A system-associated [unclassified Roseateles]MBB3282039.1 putative O-glycosylation ligase (exosortase A-associated) [Mitsuaria sp. BK037]MBB3294091.1 putative O-glycosylation ligase (exosortase A-associated) [Mitsuaria sp. BK041]MBB3363308.1 putative O-glycosylation ligase (exosortase A-associated) [Mitsuaria sp. BK045]